MRRATVTRLMVCGGLALAVFAGPALAAGRLVSAAPVRAGDQLACRIATAGLPDDKQLQSMRSGLVAAIELNLALVDAGDRVLAGRSLSLRLGFDLWEEHFSVLGAGPERRFRSLAELQGFLAQLDDLPVVPLARLDDAGRYRLRVGLVAHAVARDEQERVGNLIAGETRGGRERQDQQDQQEASVSLGRLIRFFYQGTRDDREGQELDSDWFRRAEVHDAPH